MKTKNCFFKRLRVVRSLARGAFGAETCHKQLKRQPSILILALLELDLLMLRVWLSLSSFHWCFCAYLVHLWHLMKRSTMMPLPAPNQPVCHIKLLQSLILFSVAGGKGKSPGKKSSTPSTPLVTPKKTKKSEDSSPVSATPTRRSTRKRVQREFLSPTI